MDARDATAALDRALVHDPYHPDFDELRAVVGDLLLAEGDPRGQLLALERAALAGELAPSSYEARVHGWLDAHAPELARTASGGLTYLRELELCGGLIVGLSIDLMAEVWATGETLTERTDKIVRGLARAPICRQLRALQIRVAHEDQAEVCLTRVELSARGLPLEQLTISPTGHALGHQTRNHAVALRRYYPRLWFVTRFARITPLIELELLDAPAAWALSEVAEGTPSGAELRVAIGRALSSGAERTTHAACERIAALGPSGEVFAPAIDQLLQPRVSPAAPWLLDHLPSFGPWALRRLGPRLDQLASDPRSEPSTRTHAARSRQLLEAT